MLSSVQRSRLRSSTTTRFPVSSSELASGDRVHIALPRPRGEAPLFLWARVVRSDEAGARGLAFESATPFDRNRLEQLGNASASREADR